MVNYKDKFIVIVGPCVIESRYATLKICSYLKDIFSRFPFLFIFKASFDKANRTSVRSFRGPGLRRGIKILEEVKKKLGVPIISDVHCRNQVKAIKDVLDVIQIPAFLCRQTDLIIEAAKTKKIVNIKKGQFLAPDDVRYVVDKVRSTGNKNIFITERGNCFGYRNLVVDFRSFLIMKKLGYPVLFDATHSLQRPSAQQGVSGGDRKYVAPLSFAAVACGVDGLFMEVHPDPQRALSDKYTSYPLGELESLLKRISKIREVLVNQ
ncbi:MAG: 3-deoxy-8-phosphooctulonate synthase [Candidatus Omnitrophota bacterium]|nr:MAG: 3-deoxy-8-phosphooctulonate synthase [Candidatus Omnitrophota bacterium]